MLTLMLFFIVLIFSTAICLPSPVFYIGSRTQHIYYGSEDITNNIIVPLNTWGIVNMEGLYAACSQSPSLCSEELANTCIQL
jgi:hypothetical protein